MARATNDETGKHACDADFFVGDYEVQRGGPSKSKELLEWVMENCRHLILFTARRSGSLVLRVVETHLPCLSELAG